MRTLRRFLHRVAASAGRRRDEDRMREEIEEHIALQTSEYIRAGYSPLEARRLALVKFGPMESVKEHYRDEQGLPFLDSFLQDARYTLRQLYKAPLFALTATLSLAMGIGANGAVFAVIERVLFRPLPVENPHELVYVADERVLHQVSPRFSYPFYLALRDNDVLQGVAARSGLAVNAKVNGQALRISGELVSGSYFSVVGARTQAGRSLTPDDDRTPGAHAVIVISDGFWRRHFGSDPAVLGRGIQINDRTFTIVGVAAPAFTGTDVGHPADIWVPMIMQREIGRDFLADARTNWLEIVGRLDSARQREAAAAELSAYLRRRAPELWASFPDRRLMLTPGDKGSSPVRVELSSALGVLMALTMLALGLACVNVASLVAVRSAAREKEFAIRQALGAGHSRVTRQLLTETLILAALGGTAGLLIAPWAIGLLLASQPHPLGVDTTLDVRLFLFAVVASVLAGLVVAQAPILVARRVGLVRAASRRVTAHDLIVSVQIAMALAMLISAGLFVRTLRSLNSVDPGFRADNLLLVTLDPRAADYDATQVEGFWRQTLDRVSQVRGVENASLARLVPLMPGGQRQPVLDPAAGEVLEIDANFVGPAYFRTLGIPLLGGREFDERDGRASKPVAIVNERLAHLFWPGQDPLGRVLRLGRAPGSPVLEVVGVVKDVKYRDLRGDSGPMFYRALLQTRSTDAMTLHVRAAGPLGPLVSALRHEIQRLDPRVPLFRITTLEEQLDASFAQTRQAALLTGAFGIIALLLSGIGVYGVTALAVSRRTRDIGIRMALGAQPRDIVLAVGRRGAALVIAGLGLGVLGSLGFTRITGALLFGVTAADGVTFSGMAALLALVTLTALAIPIRRATRLDAVAAIRHE